MILDRILRPLFRLQAPFRGDPGFPAKSSSFSSQLPPSHVPPPNMVNEVGTARRKDETKRLATPSRLPFPPISGLGRVVTRQMIVSVSEASSLRLFDVRSEKVVAGLGVERKTTALMNQNYFL